VSGTGTALWRRVGRRRAPLLALTGLIVVGMLATTWAAALTRTWEAQLTQRAAFALRASLRRGEALLARAS
jgi:hypothetical protein